ncbi:hypothetical protein PVAP13_5KG532107 [Panicum virgatum]|uniref:Uncharacterized protein n=1 Tax=Panicum virgatum TaxID=38727 RepID=A0A8T0SWP8_PANVG|nr:hypothetical protein PVAP13_5KG532107 [Panicum virgatum]
MSYTVRLYARSPASSYCSPFLRRDNASFLLSIIHYSTLCPSFQ